VSVPPTESCPSHSPLPVTPRSRMRVFILLCLVPLLVEATNTLVEADNSTLKAKCSWMGVNKKKFFFKWTETTGSGKQVKPVADQQCWWDLNRFDCGKCKNGGAQCGFPMHKWCQSPKFDGKKGCPGVPQNKFTLSSMGYPCYAKPDMNECAICAPGRIQCKKTGDKCGNFCRKFGDLKCDGIPTNCFNIPTCAVKAECNKKKKCECKAGYTGNGYGQCIDDATGLVAVNPKDKVEVTIDTQSKFCVSPPGSDECTDMSY